MKLSIITVCFNNKDGLIKTIDSVRNQTYKDYEFIVIDGGSKDGSKEIIEANKDLFSYWCSEPDGGIYQGMNKGIAHASGEYCLFLNSGDWLANNSVLQKVFSKGFDEDILYGDVIRVRGRRKMIIHYSKELTFADFYRVSAAINHQSAFIKRTLFEQYGKYREDTYLNADWHFFFKTIVQNNVSTKYLNIVTSVCDASGSSQTYSLQNPKVQYDLKTKQDLINQVLPNLAQKDLDKVCKISKWEKFKTSIKWRLSFLMPMSLFIRCY